MSSETKTRPNRLANLLSAAQEPAPVAAAEPPAERAAPAPAPSVARDPAPAPAPKRARGKKASAAAPRTVGMKSGRDYAMTMLVWRKDLDDLELKLLLLSRELGSKRRISVSALVAGLLSLAAQDEDLMRRAAEVVLGEEG